MSRRNAELSKIEEIRAKNREYQRRYRQKAKNRVVENDETGKKAVKAEIKRLNTFIDADVKEKLGQLAYSSSTSIKDVLEQLIRKEYKNWFNGSKTVLDYSKAE